MLLAPVQITSASTRRLMICRVKAIQRIYVRQRFKTTGYHRVALKLGHSQFVRGAVKTWWATWQGKDLEMARDPPRM